MRVVQTTFQVFHHFDLAREMEKRGHLEKIFSTWPWARLKREGIPRSKVETYPWAQTFSFLLEKYTRVPFQFSQRWNDKAAIAYDRWLVRHVPPCDALITLSGAALESGKRVQQEGSLYLCDRGSAHVAFTGDLLREEYSRWNVEAALPTPTTCRREEESYEHADGIVVPSSFARRSFERMGVPHEKVHTIPYGVRLERYRPLEQAPSYESGFQVLFVGAGSLQKGVPYLLQAFAAVRASQKRLRIIGDILPELKPALARCSLRDVEFCGSAPKPDVIRAMQTSHVLVLPSIQDGFGLVLAEAMACGCPVIGSEHTGAPDLITSGEEGYTFPVRDVGVLTAQLQSLADNPDLQASMRLKSLQRVRAMAGWTEYGDAWEALLTGMLREKQRL